MDYINIKINDKRYVQRNRFSKFIIFYDDGRKLSVDNIKELPKEDFEFLDGLLKIQNNPEKYFEYEINESSGIVITKYIGTDLEHIVIPYEINNLNVVAIDRIFGRENSFDIKSIVLPDTVREITEFCFSNMPQLETVVLSRNINQIPFACFADDRHLKNINLENVEFIDSQGFSNCTQLNNINLENVTKLNNSAFSTCNNLTEISLPKIKETGKSVFEFCVNLENVVLGNELRNIEIGTFTYCPKLKNIKLPEELKLIKRNAFQDCKDLSSIEFPKTLQRIEKQAFFNTGLTNITLPETLEDIASHAFEECKLTQINISKNTEYATSAFDIEALAFIRIYDKISEKIKNIFRNTER